MQHKLAAITAVILAGGLGTRLRPVVSDRAKVLADVDGQPIIRFILDHLSVSGVKSVVLCAGYKGFDLENTLGASHAQMHLDYSHETSPLGTAGALRNALPFMCSDPLLVLNGDSICTGDIAALLDRHLDTRAAASIMLVHQEDTRSYGRVETDVEDRVTAFREKSDTTGPGWVNAGIYVLSREFIESIPEDRQVSLEKETFPAWIDRGLYAFQSGGALMDIGTPERYAAAPEFFRALPEAWGGRGTP